MSLGQEEKNSINIQTIWNELLNEQWKEAGDRLQSYPVETLSQDTSIVHMLYGCWLMATEGKEIASVHFSGLLDVPYPRTWSLLGYFLKEKIDKESGWHEKAFLWEKRQLYRQLSLFCFCLSDKEESKRYQQLANDTYV
jgi:serine/threonine-protein kinase